MRSHNTVYETARRDLLALEQANLLRVAKKGRGRTKLFAVPPDLLERIQTNALAHISNASPAETSTATQPDFEGIIKAT